MCISKDRRNVLHFLNLPDDRPVGVWLGIERSIDSSLFPRTVVWKMLSIWGSKFSLSLFFLASLTVCKILYSPFLSFSEHIILLIGFEFLEGKNYVFINVFIPSFSSWCVINTGYMNELCIIMQDVITEFYQTLLVSIFV